MIQVIKCKHLIKIAVLLWCTTFFICVFKKFCLVCSKKIHFSVVKMCIAFVYVISCRLGGGGKCTSSYAKFKISSLYCIVVGQLCGFTTLPLLTHTDLLMGVLHFNAEIPCRLKDLRLMFNWNICTGSLFLPKMANCFAKTQQLNHLKVCHFIRAESICPLIMKGGTWHIKAAIYWCGMKVGKLHLIQCLSSAKIVRIIPSYSMHTDEQI